MSDLSKRHPSDTVETRCANEADEHEVARWLAESYMAMRPMRRAIQRVLNARDAEIARLRALSGDRGAAAPTPPGDGGL